MTKIIGTALSATFVALAMLGTMTPADAAGAIAIGRCDRFGYSFDHGNATLAHARALGECARNGDRGCRIVVDTRNNCGAFAVDAANPCGARGWGMAPNRGRAERIAVNQCSKHGGRNCRVRAWTCDRGG